jgi:glycosyltransferase involved in cell wall biosynthesis
MERSVAHAPLTDRDKSGYDVVMLVLNDVAFDGRVRSEAAALAGAGWRVLVVGTQRANGNLPDRETMQGFELRRVRYGRFGEGLWRPWRWIRHGLQAWQIVRALSGLPTRAYHAHDLPALILVSVALALHRRRAILVYDAHELYLFQSPYHSRPVDAWHRVTRPLFMRLEKCLARRADTVLALAEGRARLLERWYGIPRPVVIQNALDPVRIDILAPVDLRRVVGEGRRCVVHTGDIDGRRRAVTELVRAMVLLPEDVALVFLGQGESAETVLALAEKCGTGDRLFLVSPVTPEQVAVTIRTADVAAILMRTESWNTRAGLPNKLFEAVAAGVPILASDMFVLRRIVRRYNLGLLCDQDAPASIAGALRQLLSTEAQAYYRKQVQAAQRELNWQIEAEKLRAIYRGLLA